MTRTILKALGVVALGALGMGLWQVGTSVYFDWRFLHTVRVMQEQQAARPQAAPARETP
jgi:hypothetical protein